MQMAVFCTRCLHWLAGAKAFTSSLADKRWAYLCLGHTVHRRALYSGLGGLSPARPKKNQIAIEYRMDNRQQQAQAGNDATRHGSG